MCFPLGIILLVCAVLSVALIYLPNIPFSDFSLFIFSIVSLVLSVVFVALDFVFMWPVEEPSQTYPYHSLGSNPKPQKHKTIRSKGSEEPCDPPTREQLDKLKEALGLEKGSLQFKRRGFGVYHVLYNGGKRSWSHLGSWKELKEKLNIESTVE